MRKNNRKKGFTLIELLVVIAIIGILAAIATPMVVGNESDKNIAQDTMRGTLDSVERLLKDIVVNKTVRLDPKIAGFTINGKEYSCSDREFFGVDSAKYDLKTQTLYTVAYLILSPNSRYKINNIDYIYFIDADNGDTATKWVADEVQVYVKDSNVKFLPKGASKMDLFSDDLKVNDLMKIRSKHTNIEISISMIPADIKNKKPERVESVEVKCIGYGGEKGIYFYRFDYPSQKQIYYSGKKSSVSEVISARKKCLEMQKNI